MLTVLMLGLAWLGLLVALVAARLWVTRGDAR